jgi:ribosomal protein L11 methylase PrmA
MTPIKNMVVYNAGMRKSMLDKIWWLDKINDDVDIVLDYGCADGALLSMVHEMNDGIALVGYDFNAEMIKLAQNNLPEGHFFNNYANANTFTLADRAILVASSVFHEIENYSHDVTTEYERIFNNEYKYIAIRDMFVSEKSYKFSDQLTVARVRQQFDYNKIQEFETHIGSLDYNENLLQFFLTYRYKENWDREVRENYFPHTIEQFLNKIPDHYQVVYFEHYTLPFVRDQVWKDFGVQLIEPTHAKILLKLKDGLDD